MKFPSGLSALATATFVAITPLQGLAHEAADNELAHQDFPDIIYAFCDSYYRGIAAQEILIKNARKTIENDNSTFAERAKARRDIEHYTVANEDAERNIEWDRQELTDHGYLHGSCGVQL